MFSGALPIKIWRGTFMKIRDFAEMTMAKRDQVTLLLEPELRAFAERQAAAEDRKLTQWIRHLVAEAARAAALAGGGVQGRAAR